MYVGHENQIFKRLPFLVSNMAEPFRMTFKSENRSYSNYSGTPEEQFVHIVPNPSDLSDTEFLIVKTNDFNSSTIVCVQIDILDSATKFNILVHVKISLLF